MIQAIIKAKFFLLIAIVSCSPDPVNIPSSSSKPGSQNASPYNSFTDVEKAQAFGSTLHPVLVSYCAQCHGAAQAPLHAIDDTFNAFKAGDSYINFDNLPNSRFYRRVKVEDHNCSPNCDQIAADILNALQEFKTQLESL